MKGIRKLALISAACMIFSGTLPAFPAMPVQAEEEEQELRSGFCGEHVKWEMLGGDLNIWGDGAMYDFADPDDPDSDAEPAPWIADARYVHVSGNVTHIGANAFANCTEMWFLDIGNSVKTIGTHALYNCADLKVVDFPESISRLEGRILDGNVSPREITIRNRDAVISDDAFILTRSTPAPKISGYRNSTAQAYAEANGFGFSALYEPDPSYPDGQECGYNLKWKLDRETGTLTISGDGYDGSMNDYYADYDPFSCYSEYLNTHYRFSVPEEEQVPWDKDKDVIRHIVIEEGVYSVGAYAFYDCKNLESVELPDSLSSIGPFAFSSCGLESITIPQKTMLIDLCAFQNCPALSEIIFDGSPSIQFGSYAFNSCPSLKSIRLPEKVFSLGTGAFSDCKNLTELSVPESVNYFGADIFDGTPWLEKQCSTEPYIIINRHMLACGTANKGKITLPDDVYAIESRAFAGQKDITDIVISDNTCMIADEAFKDCTGLQSVQLPALLNGDGLNSGAFSGCTALKELTIPLNVTLIRPFVCKDCTALKTVTVLNPNAIFPTTDDLPFTNQEGSFTGTLRGYAGSTAQTYAEDHGWKFESLGAAPPTAVPLDYCGEEVTWKLEEDGTLRISGRGDMYDYYSTPGWVSAAPAAAASPEEIESTVERGLQILFGDTGTRFRDPRAVPWERNRSDIKAVVVEDGVTSVGSSAFQNCPNLETVRLADSVEKIGMYAFCDCASLQSVSLPKGLKSLDERCFYLCSGLPEISIPTGTEFIGLDAFSGCTSLASVTFPDTIQDIESRVFENTPWLENRKAQDQFVIEGGVLLAYSGTFKDSIVIPDGVRVIGGGALERAAQSSYSNNDVTSVTIPDGVTTICELAFCWCDNMQKLEMPDTVTDIKDSAFFNCFALQDFRMSENLRTIGSAAFGNCQSIRNVTIPKSVTRIGSEAFVRCNSLETVTILNPKTEILGDRDTFSNPEDMEYGVFSGIIRGYEGSTAQKYAKHYQRKFEILAENAPEALSKRGDINGDSSVDVADAVLLARYLNSDAEAKITDQGLRNADCDQNGKADSQDLTMILQYIAKKITF